MAYSGGPTEQNRKMDTIAETLKRRTYAVYHTQHRQVIASTIDINSYNSMTSGRTKHQEQYYLTYFFASNKPFFVCKEKKQKKKNTCNSSMDRAIFLLH